MDRYHRRKSIWLSFLKFCGTRKVSFSINEYDFYALIEKPCSCCGQKVGLNRIAAINPINGFTKDNIKPICSGCGSTLYPFPC